MERFATQAKGWWDRANGPTVGLIAGTAYFGFSQFVLWLNDPVNIGAGFWPGAGITLAALLLVPSARWPWILAAVAVAEFGGDLLHGYPAGGIAFWTAGNLVEPLVAAFLIRRVLPGPPALAPLGRLMGFVAFGVIVGPAVGASVGSLGTIIYFDMSFADVWPKYVVGDALGVLVVAPVFLCWFGRRHYRSSLETATLVVSLSLITLLVFRNWEARWDASLPFLVIPLLTWASLRFGVRGAAAASFVVAQVANASTALGYGPFAIAGTTTHAVTLLQLFVAVTVVSALALAAVTEDLLDRREVEKRLSAQNKELQTALEEIYKSHLYIRKLEGILPICMNCKSVRSDDDSDWLPLDSYLMTRKDALSLSHTLCPSCAEERAFL